MALSWAAGKVSPPLSLTCCPSHCKTQPSQSCSSTQGSVHPAIFSVVLVKTKLPGLLMCVFLACHPLKSIAPQEWAPGARELSPSHLLNEEQPKEKKVTLALPSMLKARKNGLTGKLSGVLKPREQPLLSKRAERVCQHPTSIKQGL